MQGALKVILFLLVFPAIGQNGGLEGRVLFKLDSMPISGATIVITGTRIGTQTDIDGNFKLDHLKPGTYDLHFEYLGYGRDTIRNVHVKNESIEYVSLGLPAGKCFEKADSKACPVDGRLKNVIPIIYGLPDKKLRRKLEKGKIKLGGCEVTGCEPNWFCKEHNQEF